MSTDIYQAEAPQQQHGAPVLPVKPGSRLLDGEEEEQTVRVFYEGDHQQQQHDDGITPSAAPGTGAVTGSGRPRTATNTAEIDTALSHPGSVRINVKGAFIVDQETVTPPDPTANGGVGAGTGNGTSANIGVGNGNGHGVGVGNGRASPSNHETKDIRLPNHTAVVSHIAVDVCHEISKCPWFNFDFISPISPHCPVLVGNIFHISTMMSLRTSLTADYTLDRLAALWQS